MAFPNWFTRPQKDFSVAEVSAKRFAVLTHNIATGEVQASPTSYTLLARLKDIVTQLAAGIQMNGWVWTTSFGIASVAFTSADQHSAAAVVTSVPTSGKKLVIDNIIVAADAAQVFTFTEETTGTIVGYACVPANGTANFRPEGKLKLATADKRLKVQSSQTGNVYVTAFYHSET